jgi:EmrB/QacA subfamily drug resistance transporter
MARGVTSSVAASQSSLRAPDNDPGPAELTFDAAAGKWVIAAAVLGSGMASLDATVVNIALPALGRDLHAGFEGLQWTINGYTLTLAALILLGGSLGDRFGRRRVFVIGTVWFALASALCALASSIEILVVSRALEGIGAALLTPGSLAMIQASFTEQDRGKAIGAWSGFGGIASAIGPFVGGYLVAGPGWQWVFLINLPLAVVVIAIARRHVPESHDPQVAPRLDTFGAALGAVGLAAVTYALIGASGGWSTGVFISGAIGIGALFGFVINERYCPNPMLPHGIFRSRQFTAANIVTLVVYAALSGLFFFVVVDLQVVAGFSPLLAGSALLPVTVIMLALSAQAGALLARIGPRLPMSLGPLVAACGVLLLLRIGVGASYVIDILPAVTVLGLGLALMVAPLTTTVLGAAAPEHAGIASGINNAVARAAGLLAVAVLPLLAGISGDAYQHTEAFSEGFRIAMITCVVLLVAGGVLAAITIRNPVTRHSLERPVRRQFCAIDGPPLQPRVGPVKT